MYDAVSIFWFFINTIFFSFQIIGDYCCGKGRNLVHASDSVESAKKEINIWFKPNEVLDYKKTVESWLYPG